VTIKAAARTVTALTRCFKLLLFQVLTFTVIAGDLLLVPASSTKEWTGFRSMFLLRVLYIMY